MIIGKETEQIEFKLSTGEKNEALRSICAILNKHKQGTLYFGIKDNGYVVGQMIADSTKRDISRWINESIYPKITPTIDVINLDNKEIIKVTFSGQNRPYSVNGDFLIRIGTENRKMSSDELKRLIKHDDYASHWEEELTDYGIKEIDDETLKDFYNSSVECGRLLMKKYDKEKILTSIGVLFDKKINNAGLAVFGKHIKIGLKLANYATDDKTTILDLKLINGNIYNLVDEAINYILKNIKWRSEINKRKRDEVPEIPERAIREIVFNSFAHANYESLPEIEIGIHPGKIEIYNPGTFPEELTPFDYIDKNIPSYKRNRLILDILFRSKDVEKSGTGFQRVNSSCNEYGVNWNYRKDNYGFLFEFIRTNVHLNVHIKDELSDQEQVVFNIIHNNKKVTKKEISARISKSEKTVQRTISSLRKKGLIVRKDSNKTGYWEVSK